MLTLICKDSPEGILSAIYEAWAFPLPNSELAIVIEGQYQQELFTEYKETVCNEKYASKVADSIHRKLSPEVWNWVWLALMAQEADKAQIIFSFLRTAFSDGARVTKQLARPEVMRIFELKRMVSRELQHLQGFVRFAETKDGILISGITPKHRQVPLVAPHFSNRFPQERFIIYDKKRCEAVVHEPGAGWYLTETDRVDLLEEIVRQSENDEFAKLWKAFFKSIAIEKRSNKSCQNCLLPKRFRPNMTEFRNPQHGMKEECSYSLDTVNFNEHDARA